MANILNSDMFFKMRFYNNASFPVHTGKVIQLSAVPQEMVRNPSTGQMELKLVLCFVGLDRGIICSQPNFDVFVATWGRDADIWLGKNVVVGREPCSSAPGGLRVRFTPVNEPAAAPQPKTGTDDDVPF